MELIQAKLLKKLIKKNKYNKRFFSTKKKSNELKIKFDFITSIAMFYDLDDPNKFVKKLSIFFLKMVFGYSNSLI